MAGLDLVTPPASEPITLADAKRHLAIEDDDWDEILNAYIAAARSAAESFLKMSLLTTGWRYRIDRFFPWEIRLPIGPVFDTGDSPNSLSVSYIDDAGATQILAETEYQVSFGETAVIRPAYGKVWPSTRPVMDAVTVEFEAGWESAGDIPKAIMQGMWLTVGDFFAQRENIVIGQPVAEIPTAARNLMMPFVRHD